MDALPIFPPPPKDANPASPADGIDPEIDPNKRDYLLMIDYETYDPEKHLNPKDVEIEGGVPAPIPFSISPLHLPEMLRSKLSQEDLTVHPTFSKDLDLPGLSKIQSLINKIPSLGEGFKLPPVRFEPDTLKIDIMAAYPLLMPLHLAELSYKDREGRRQKATYCLGAWGKAALPLSIKKGFAGWNGPYPHNAPFDLDILDVFPRVPVKGKLRDFFERKRMDDKKRTEEERAARIQKVEGEWDREGISKTNGKYKLSTKKRDAFLEAESDIEAQIFNDELALRELEAQTGEVPLMAAVQRKSLELMEQTDWRALERDEREAYQNRVSNVDPKIHAVTSKERERLAALSSTSPSSRASASEPRPFRWLSRKADRVAEERHPDRLAGLGKYIYWTSPHVQRLSHNAHANRRYLGEAVPNTLASRKRMAVITASGADVDHIAVTLKEEGKELQGEKAVQTIRSRDLEQRQTRERLRPRWVKELEGSLPPRRP